MLTEPGSYRELSAQLDAAFADMEVAWIEWRDSRPNHGALTLYLQSLAECQFLHQLLKEFPQYEPFRKDFPTSPSNDGVGVSDSHGVSSHGCVGREGMDERTSRGAGGAGLCPRRFPLFGAAVPGRLAFGRTRDAGRVLRDRAAAGVAAMTPEARMLWVVLATVCGLPVIAAIIHLILHS